MLVEGFDDGRLQYGGTSSTIVYLRNTPLTAEHWQQQFYLAMERLDVGLNRRLALHAVRVTGAIVAQMAAEGYVQIEREVALFGRVRFQYSLTVFIFRIISEEIGRRVTRITRYGYIIFINNVLLNHFESILLHFSGTKLPHIFYPRNPHLYGFLRFVAKHTLYKKGDFFGFFR